MKKVFLKVVLLGILCYFSAVTVTFSADELSKVIFKVDTKSKEAKVKIETVISMLKGVSEVEFDFGSKKLEVKFDPAEIDERMIQYTVEAMGYPVRQDNTTIDKRNLYQPQDSTKK